MFAARDLLRGFRKAGCIIDTKRGKGSHVLVSFEHEGKIVAVTTVPRKVPPGTLRAIRRAFCLDRHEDFQRLLEGRLRRDDLVEILRQRNRLE